MLPEPHRFNRMYFKITTLGLLGLPCFASVALAAPSPQIQGTCFDDADCLLVSTLFCKRYATRLTVFQSGGTCKKGNDLLGYASTRDHYPRPERNKLTPQIVQDVVLNIQEGGKITVHFY